MLLRSDNFLTNSDKVLRGRDDIVRRIGQHGVVQPQLQPIIAMTCRPSRFDRARLFLALTFALLNTQLPVLTVAQESSVGEEAGEALQLSPFEVSVGEDRGYAAPPPPQGPRFRNGGTASRPNVPVTLIRRADAAIIEFALSNSADKQDVRNQELTASVELIAQAIKATPGLRFENREVQLATGNRSRSLVGKGGVVTSFANFAVFAEVGGEVRLFERVKQVRNLVVAAKLAGGTKAIDGPVAL
ncbi:MAG: hypothetical protein ABIZ49_01840, partial [Opitutaceae bacterium]